MSTARCITISTSSKCLFVILMTMVMIVPVGLTVPTWVVMTITILVPGVAGC